VSADGNAKRNAAAKRLRALGLDRSDLPKTGDRVVYFVRSAGLIKVGTSEGLKGRVKGIQMACSAPVLLLAFGPGNREREQHLHELFSAEHHHGEWFRPSPLIEHWMREAQADSWAWQHLPPWKEPLPFGPPTLREHRESVASAKRFYNSPFARALRASRAASR